MSMPTPTEREQLAKAFKALSSPNRLAMYLDLLAQEETSVPHCCLGDLISRLEIGAPTVSHHIKELVNAGLIEVLVDVLGADALDQLAAEGRYRRDVY